MFGKDSFQNLIRVNKFFLQFFGILPLNGHLTTWKRRISKFLSVFTLCCVTSIIVPIFHLMISANLDLKSMLDILIAVAGVLGAEFRMIFVVLNRKKIQKLYTICEALWLDASLSDFKIISVWTKRAKLLSVILCSIAISAVSLYILLPIIKQIRPNADISTRSWPFQINMDPTQSPRYEIFYVVQSIAAGVIIFSMSGCDLIGPVVALHACGQLKLIQYWLLKISKEDKLRPGEQYIDKNLEDQLKACLKRHQLVMDLCAELEEVVCYANLAQALSGMYMMAISAARLTKIQSEGIYKPLGTLFLSIGLLFISCWPAEKLLFESTMVAKAIYAIPWYRCSPRIKKTIVFMMVRSQRPVQLTAGKFVILSLETFASIVSAAISIFMLLRSFEPGT